MRLYFRGDPAIYSREDRIYYFFLTYASFLSQFIQKERRQRPG